MERVRDIVGATGIEIPFPLIEQYGLQPGSPFLIEFGEKGLRIVPPTSQEEEIGTQALLYLFRKLGDAIRIEVEQADEEWKVTVLDADIIEPLGYLIYSATGELMETKSTPIEVMRQKALLSS